MNNIKKNIHYTFKKFILKKMIFLRANITRKIAFKKIYKFVIH